jgi:hypothetical protein
MKVRLKMKAKKTISYMLCITAAMFLLFSSCAKKDSATYGREITNRNITEVKAVLTTPETFDGKTVTVKGKIVNECPSGCWLEVQEGSAILYVDLNPSGFAIPQKVGKEVVVEGNVSMRDNKPIMTGTGVEIK